MSDNEMPARVAVSGEKKTQPSPKVE